MQQAYVFPTENKLILFLFSKMPNNDEDTSDVKASLAPQVTIVYNFSTKSLKLQASLWTVKAGSVYIYCCRCCFRSGLICSISGRATLGALCIFQKLFLPIPASQVPSESYQPPLWVFINGWSLMTRPSCSKW